jgi:undecaprenyl-diphosphatase
MAGSSARLLGLWTSALRRLRLRPLERHELTWLIVGLGACALLFLFISLASQVVEGDTQALDVKALQALRNPADPSKPIGPDWLPTFVADLTALGGFPVLSLVVAIVVGFLLLQTRYHTALFVGATAISGELFNFILKHTFNRARPTVIPNVIILSPSFPSGHAMESAIVYLTLGAVLMRVAEQRLTKMYILGVAVLLTVMVGLSRVYLGVHYPTDVIGGWTVGFMWASVCWLVAQRFEQRAIEQERNKAE